MEFLQWALPRLSLSWTGFRRVHRQVCHRIAGRLEVVRLPDCGAYREYLISHPEEWTVFDSLCRISISQWWRDSAVWERLGDTIIPELAVQASAAGRRTFRCWSAGCASGEEPYSLRWLWMKRILSAVPGVALEIIATDVDPVLLERAAAASYRHSSVRGMPAGWAEAFEPQGQFHVLRAEFREGVRFVRQDIRDEVPDGSFDLVLCRNLVFTYFDVALQRRTLERILGVLENGGALVIGLKEDLPSGVPGLVGWVPDLGIYRKTV
ncbi:MAG: methyltransferase domain-containing protein [Gemmatimonadetes bacterium]|nr:methyltransferase domain-containing protein [Gemmatimonadota bacterium]